MLVEELGLPLNSLFRNEPEVGYCCPFNIRSSSWQKQLLSDRGDGQGSGVWTSSRPSGQGGSYLGGSPRGDHSSYYHFFNKATNEHTHCTKKMRLQLREHERRRDNCYIISAMPLGM